MLEVYGRGEEDTRAVYHSNSASAHEVDSGI